ncbi:linamarin synthase 1-like [Cucumis melo]|uniref:Linamarin synthase 1-like n=1 Tax=Cucumis melo TaxID=3656 RepID=A0ABM3L7L0_CUCME|nr:linamarin synthase 1-like [Cucumis melo]
MGALAETNHIGDESQMAWNLVQIEMILVGDEITIFIADESLGWAPELAVKMRIQRVAFSPASAAMLCYSKEGVFPLRFQERIESCGKIVGWAPQQRCHPSIACFVNHCGWNSTLESLSNGIRFLCWPYFADQFPNESYICDIWKVGLKLKKDKYGIVTRTEIKEKVEKLIADED